MNTYITGATIKKLREARGLTQLQLADKIGVTAKAVSKWETAKGLPDISLIEPLGRALGVSVMELMSGNTVTNKNASSNILLSKLYPEGNAEVRMQLRGRGYLYIYCNRHGLMRKRV